MARRSARELLRLGREHREKGHAERAVRALMRAVELEPRLLPAVLELAALLEEQGDLDASLLCFEQATAIDLSSFDAQLGLARALRKRGRLDVAVAHYQCATLLKPNAVEPVAELGSVLDELGRYDAAYVHLTRALELDPSSATVRAAIGGIWQTRGDYDRALEHYEVALTASPDAAAIHVQHASALFETARHEEAIAACRRAVECGATQVAHGGLLYGLAFAPGATARSIHAESLEYDRLHAAPLRPSTSQHSNAAVPEKRLRVGYVSPDFRSHCQALFVTPLFRHHDHERFEIVCYSTTTRRDAVTDRLKRLADTWRDVADHGDEALAKRIGDDGIDILVDLTMHMSQNRALVFARKPAPVQICWLAYPGTTGNRSIDYRVSDRHIDPPGLDDAYYVEETLRLPDTFWCYDPQSDAEVAPLPALQNGYVTFGCLNNFAKANAEALTNFARVLAALPGSRLLLSCPAGEARRRGRELFAERAVDPARVDFVGRKPREDYLALYDQIDACLDTVPYNGHTTSLDAIWKGVPVVTLVGTTVVGRAGLCLAENLGMPETVARTPEEFVTRAIELTSDLDRLIRLRSSLRSRLASSPLMDAPRFARNLEALYREAWIRYCARRA